MQRDWLRDDSGLERARQCGPGVHSQRTPQGAREGLGSSRERQRQAVSHGRICTAIRRIRPEWPLRLGCGLVNFYAGFFLLTDPARFYKYMPHWLSQLANAVASVDAYLRLQGLGELTIATCLLGWFLPRWCVRLAATLLSIEMTLILLCTGIDGVTFRNMGLVGAACALLLSAYQDTEG